MANAMGDWLEDQVLTWFKGTSMPAAPATLWLGLLTAMPADTGSAGAPADGTEATGTGYARVSITTSTGWSAISTSGTTRQISNAGTLTFPQAGGSWGTIIGWALYDASTLGHLVAYGSITSQAITNGMTPSLAAGQVVLQAD